MRLAPVVLASLVLLAPRVQAQTVGAPYLVKDINATADPSGPHAIAAVGIGGRALVANFSGDRVSLLSVSAETSETTAIGEFDELTLMYGPEYRVAFGSHVYFGGNRAQMKGLWRTDGTAAGTQLVKASPRPLLFFALDDGIGFLASDGGPAWELWRSDGTTQGTVREGTIPVVPSGGGVVAAGALAFFTGSSAAEGYELWRTDGTVAGTVVARDIRPGPDSSNPGELHAVGDVVVFTADDGTSGAEPWRSDGSPAGTFLLRDIRAGSARSEAASFTLHEGQLYFIADDGQVGFEPWRTDGTVAGTVLVKDVTPGPAGSYPYPFTRSSAGLFFVARDQSNRARVWRTDGTSTGTIPISDSFAYADCLATVSDRIVFLTDDGGARNLWSSNGSPDNVQWVSTGNHYCSGYSVGPDGRLYLAGFDPTAGVELWSTDGTSAGTRRVADIRPAGSSDPFEIVTLGDSVLFSADDGAVGRELWMTDGSAGGTRLVVDSNTATRGSNAGGLRLAGGRLYFYANDGVHGEELWTSDGTRDGTVLVKDLRPGAETYQFGGGEFTEIGGAVLFHALDMTGPGGSPGEELWRTDGTAAGTFLVKDIADGPEWGQPHNFHEFNGLLYFMANDPAHGFELRVSDGTDAGTTLVKDIASGAKSSYPQDLTTLAGKLIFSADDEGPSGDELWVSDWTASGTVLLKDIAPGPTDSSPHRLIQLGSILMFGANDVAHGYELWRTDGTAAGTVLVEDILAGPASSGAAPKAALNGELILSANDGVTGSELWVSDGTSGGTELLKDINPGAASSFADDFVAVGGILFFTANDGVHGKELWRTDGTASGTLLVADVRPGAAGSSPFALTAFGSRLVFLAESRIWQTDGTAAGTVALGWVNQFSGASLTPMGDKLFFTGSGEQSGARELWALGPCGNGTVDTGEACDDGNNVDGDCCSSACAVEVGACDDGNACTQGDFCNGAGCESGAPVQCSGCRSCDADAGCIVAPQTTGCRRPTAPGQSALDIKNHPVDNVDVVTWKWMKGAATTPSDLGTPLVDDDYTFCVFDESEPDPSLILEATAPAGGTCRGKACWKALGNPPGSLGYTYADGDRTPSGLANLTVKPGANGKAKVTLKGVGNNLRLPGEPGHLHGALPLQEPANVRAQLRGNGQCWEAHFNGDGVLRNDPRQLKAKGN